MSELEEVIQERNHLKTLLGELWDWQKTVQELPPDALTEKVMRALGDLPTLTELCFGPDGPDPEEAEHYRRLEERREARTRVENILAADGRFDNPCGAKIYGTMKCLLPAEHFGPHSSLPLMVDGRTPEQKRAEAIQDARKVRSAFYHEADYRDWLKEIGLTEAEVKEGQDAGPEA